MLIDENPLPFCLVTERVEVLPHYWSLSVSKCCLASTTNINAHLLMTSAFAFSGGGCHLLPSGPKITSSPAPPAYPAYPATSAPSLI